MAIPLRKEDPELFEEFGVHENCYFCNSKTDMWHNNTNNPVCPKCAKTHKVAELPNRFKGETRGRVFTKQDWYTADELKHYLRTQNYSNQIADELCEQYAKNLQLAYEKGISVASNPIH